jgi:hypothetical protein
MIDATIHIEKDGTYYPTQIHVLPSVGDIINLTSYSDMANNHTWKLKLKVLRVEHSVIEFNPELTSTVKNYTHDINIYCSKSG